MSVSVLFLCLKIIGEEGHVKAPKALFLQTEERKVVTTVLEAASTGVITAR